MAPDHRIFAWLTAALVGLVSPTTGCGDGSPSPADTTPTQRPDATDAGAGDTDPGAPRDTGHSPDGADTHDDRTPIDGTGWDVGAGETDGDALPPLSLTAVTPSRGPATGGTKFAVRGDGLTTDTTIYFGSRSAEVDLVGGRLVGETPPAPGPGTVSVKAIDPETGRAAVDGGFTYTPSLVFETARPDTVPTDGGFQVTLRGSGFTPETRVSLDGTTALQHHFVGPDRLRIVVPPHEAGSADLRITNRNETILARDALDYAAPLKIDTVRPAAGPTGGDTTVTLRGSGFASGMRVDLGGREATVVDVDTGAGTATVETPPGRVGLADVSVTTPDGDAAIAEEAFYYRASDSTLHLAGVRPSSGPAAGGSRVTLVGAGLDVPGLQVTFGGRDAPVRTSGRGYAVVDLPAHPVGRVDIRVSTDRDGSRLEDGFAYVRELAIDRVNPRRGDVAGGDTLTVTGTGFRDVSNVEIGGVSAAFTVHDERTLEVTTPAHAPGTFDIVVERGDRTARLTDAFTFTEPLEVFGHSPARGAIAGNTYVQIRGRGFLGATPEVTFGRKAAPSVQVLDAQTLAVRTPAHAEGPVDVELTRGETTVTSPTPFTFFDPSVRDGGPAGGAIRGSVNVSVYAGGGAPIEHALVMLSTSPTDLHTGRTDANGQVTLSGPDVAGPQTVTAAAAGYSTATIQEVDAENVTLFLDQISTPPSPPGSDGGADAGSSDTDTPPVPDVDSDASSDGGSPRVDTGRPDDDSNDPDDPDDDLDPTPVPDRGPPVFRGELSGLDKIGLPGPNERTLAIVYTTKKQIRSRNPDPGPDNRLYGNGSYAIRTRTGDLALVAIGGLYNTETDEFDLMRMGVKRYQHATKGKTYRRDIDLDIRLDETMTFKLSDKPFHPDGPGVHYIQPYLDFGYEGYFGHLPAAVGRSRLIEAPDYPALEGKLSDLTVSALGGAYTSRGAGRYGWPRSVVLHEDIPSTTGTVEFPDVLGVPVLSTPSPGDQVTGDVIDFELTGRHRPDFFRIQLFERGGGAVFDAFVPGHADRIRLPTFPDFSSTPAYLQPDPYPTGRYYMRMLAIRGTRASFDDFGYSDLSIFKWSAYAVNYHYIEF